MNSVIEVGRIGAAERGIKLGEIRAIGGGNP
jgi:hypothetical protein